MENLNLNLIIWKSAENVATNSLGSLYLDKKTYFNIFIWGNSYWCWETNAVTRMIVFIGILFSKTLNYKTFENIPTTLNLLSVECSWNKKNQ